MENDKKLLITFSGGRTSAFMCWMVLKSHFYKDYNIIICYANTGKEREETLDFVDKCDKEFNLNLVWIEADVNFTKGKGTDYKVVDFKTANRDGSVFENVIKKYGIPSKLYRHCTRELKEVPIHKYAKDIFKTNKYLTAIGIRADEKHRIGKNNFNIYPLMQAGIDEKYIRNWWDNKGFDLKLKDYEGNCDLCFLKSTRKKLTIIHENPNISEWWQKMEDKYNKKYQPIFDVRGDLSISKLEELSSLQFSKVKDKHQMNKLQMELFNMDMDEENDCFCKLK